MPYIRKSILDDVACLARNLRQADIDELAALNLTPKQSLTQGYRCSDACYSMCMDDGSIVAMFGTFTIPELREENIATIWLLGSNKMNDIKIYFLRQSKKWLAKLISNYTMVCNAADSRNTLHINWLKWLGFKFTDDICMNGVIFKQFYLDNIKSEV